MKNKPLLIMVMVTIVTVLYWKYYYNPYQDHVGLVVNKTQINKADLVVEALQHQCPTWSPQPADWCHDGKIVKGETDQWGCAKPPDCIIKKVCPEVTPKPVDWCVKGVVVSGGVDNNNCRLPDRCVANCPEHPILPENWCYDGEIIERGVDTKGCPLPPECRSKNVKGAPKEGGQLVSGNEKNLVKEATYTFNDNEGVFKTGGMESRVLRVKVAEDCEGRASNINIFLKAHSAEYVNVATLQPGQTVDVRLTFGSSYVKAVSQERHVWFPRGADVAYKPHGEVPTEEVLSCGGSF